MEYLDILPTVWPRAGSMQFIILNIEGKCEEGRCGAKCGCGSTGSNPNGRGLDELGTRVAEELQMSPCYAILSLRQVCSSAKAEGATTGHERQRRRQGQGRVERLKMPWDNFVFPNVHRCHLQMPTCSSCRWGQQLWVAQSDLQKTRSTYS